MSLGFPFSLFLFFQRVVVHNDSAPERAARATNAETDDNVVEQSINLAGKETLWQSLPGIKVASGGI